MQSPCHIPQGVRPEATSKSCAHFPYQSQMIGKRFPLFLRLKSKGMREYLVDDDLSSTDVSRMIRLCVNFYSEFLSDNFGLCR
jgi:hypothetical protein